MGAFRTSRSNTVTGDHQTSSERRGSTSEVNLELFFDLVFTFAMSQVTQLMLLSTAMCRFSSHPALESPSGAWGATP